LLAFQSGSYFYLTQTRILSGFLEQLTQLETYWVPQRLQTRTPA
jgi:hypothetical protein